MKRTKDFTAGSLVGEEKKAKEKKLSGAGLIVQPVGPRMDQSLAVGRMLLKAEKEDVVPLVRPVKLTKEEGERDELAKYSQKGYVLLCL